MRGLSSTHSAVWGNAAVVLKQGRLTIQQQAILGGMAVSLCQYPFEGPLVEIPKTCFVGGLRQLDLPQWSHTEGM